jgi:hypothetical protein
VQIFFDGINHFVAAVSYGQNIVTIYDSLGHSLTDVLKLQIWNLFSASGQDLTVFCVVNKKQETAGNSCAVYAFAFLIDILEGICVSESSYDSDNRLRCWLKQILTNERITPAPKITTRVPKTQPKECYVLLKDCEVSKLRESLQLRNVIPREFIPDDDIEIIYETN